MDLVPLQQIGRTEVRYRGRTRLYFSGCDYFRLARHPAVWRAVRQGLRRYGLNVASSRLTTGHHLLYQRLERALARFFGAESAVLVPAGYVANLAVAGALAGRFTHALLDARAHVSLRDAAQLLGCPVRRFRHRDVADAGRLIRRCGRRARILLLTDGLYAGQGTAAPVAEYLRLLPASGRVLLDDAHGAGVLGRRGRGTPEWAGADRGRIIQTITLSKAFGVYGGAVLCSRALRRQILRNSRLFAGSTPLPLPLAHAALAALGLHRRHPEWRARLHANAARVKSALRAAGVRFAEGPGPIVQIRPPDRRQAERLRRALLAAGIYPPFVRYPGGPPQGSFRFVISSEHTPRQLDKLVAVLSRVCGAAARARR